MRYSATRSALFALVFLGTVPSCNKKESSGSAVNDVAGFCAQWASAACSDAVVDACSASSKTACQESQSDFCTSLVPEDKYSPDGAADCIVAVKKAYDDATLTSDERSVALHLGGACDKVLSGTIDRGGTCSTDSDCDRTRDLSCVKKGEAKGTCQEAVPTENGGDCTSDEAVCAAGYYCDKTVLHCIEGKKEASDCDAGTPCASGLRCADADGKTVPEGGTGSGTCLALAAVGKDCEADDNCESGICTLLANGSGVCSSKTVLGPADPVCLDLR
jgi:hypothetical protein